MLLYSVVGREKDKEVAGRQWCRLKRVFPLSEELGTLVSC